MVILAYRTYLQVTLPEIAKKAAVAHLTLTWARWLDYPGEQLISMVEVEIGGQRIDRQYGDWMHIWNQLTLTAEQERGYNKMIGHTTQLTYLTTLDFADVDCLCVRMGPAAVCAPRQRSPRDHSLHPTSVLVLPQPRTCPSFDCPSVPRSPINLELRPSDEVLFAVSH